MEIILLIAVIISFLLAFFAMPKWIKKAKQIGFLWENMNKYGHPKEFAGSGGLIVVIAFVIGVLVYIAIRTFVLEIDTTTIQILALLLTILLALIVGFIDDFLGWWSGGLSIRMRLLLMIVAAIPLVVINAGSSLIDIPFIGVVDIGLIYPLILIPLAIVGASTTYNFLAGFNGLEAGQGIILISFLSLVAYVTGSSWLALIGLCMVAALIAFFIFNKYPAKILPGDSLTYPVGALIAIMAILGNFEKIALFVFIPYIIEAILKSRGKLKKYSFGKPNKDNSLEVPYPKYYSLCHVAIASIKKIKNKVYEKDVSYFIFIMQIIFCLVALIIFRNVLF